MLKEIGGFMEYEHNTKTMLHNDSIHLNCGRRALSYLIKSEKIKKIWIPKFSCKSVIEPFEKSGCDIALFPVQKDLSPCLDNIPKDDWIVLINYYGQIRNDSIKEITTEHPNVIVDNTQAYFQEPVSEINTIYSCRKFFGVSDGAILYTNSILDETFDIDESFNRMTYVMGRFERTASEFYQLYKENELAFNNEPIKSMSKLTENILRGIDYDYVIQRRTNNFELLHNTLKDINKLNLTIPQGPFMYPLLIENGNEIRTELQKQKIYIPTLWPDVFDICQESDCEYQLAANILPIPIDQRYANEDMQRIIEAIIKGAYK